MLFNCINFLLLWKKQNNQALIWCYTQGEATIGVVSLKRYFRTQLFLIPVGVKKNQVELVSYGSIKCVIGLIFVILNLT